MNQPTSKLVQPNAFENAKRLIVAALLLFLHPVQVLAQSDGTAPLIVGTFEYPTSFLTHKAEDGTRSGFNIELLREIAKETGIPVEYRDYETAVEVFRAQVSGETTIFPGIGKLAVLADTQIYTDPVAEVQQVFVIRRDRAETFVGDPATGLRIAAPAVVLPMVERAMGADNTIVTAVDAPQAIMMVLLDTVDAALLPAAFAFPSAVSAEVDHLVTFVEAPLPRTDRHIAVHQSRADVVPAFNAAIARMEADGRLEALRRKYFFDAIGDTPDVLRVGLTHYPPYTIVEDDGSFSGFAVELLNALAARTGLTFAFEAITTTEWFDGPQPGFVDMLAQAGVNADRQTRMDFTFPIEEAPVSIFVLQAQSGNIQTLDDLSGMHVGVGEGNLAARLVQDEERFEVITFETTQALVAGLVDGAIDALLFPTGPMQETLIELGHNDAIVGIAPPFHVSERAIALRFGLGDVRQRLNSVIPGFLVTDEYAALSEKYFSEPVFWTERRVTVTLATLGALILTMLAALTFQRVRAHRQTKIIAMEREHSEQLNGLVTALEAQKTELERSNRELDEFAYIASHDLKEPLRGIGINANFLMRETLPDAARDRIVRMSALAGRMERLITDLLFFSRLGRMDGAQISVQPRQIIESIQSELSEWMEERNARIVIPAELPSLHGERLRIKTVFQNLIVNGLKYNESDEKIAEVGFVRDVTVNGNPMKNAMFVKDNGIGIQERHRDKIFRIFSRLTKVGPDDTGTGSGLAFVRKIVEESGGSVDFTSTPAGGSTFYFTLPLASDAASAQSD